jgi:hypothetical protein
VDEEGLMVSVRRDNLDVNFHCFRKKKLKLPKLTEVD